ncbi:hypothetical protein ACFVFT_38150 [Streptomyces tendae]|uniref:hypothetical protein n=1 Tax=Streptomyces tendae TaxID=1932 RepID=UPI0036C1EB83
MDWAKHTTVLAALVAAAGLGVSAWGTLLSARVAEDQLAQSKVQNEERAKRQASRITFWEEPPHSDPTVIANRSLDPVFVYVGVSYKGDHTPEYDMSVGTIPPCTAVRLRADHLSSGIPDNEPEARFNRGSATAIMFVDVYGQMWTRAEDGKLTEGVPAAAGFLRTSDTKERGKRPYVVVATTTLDLKPLEECGATG